MNREEREQRKKFEKEKKEKEREHNVELEGAPLSPQHGSAAGRRKRRRTV